MRKVYLLLYGLSFLILTIAAFLLGCTGGSSSGGGGGAASFKENCLQVGGSYCNSASWGERCCPGGHVWYYCNGGCYPNQYSASSVCKSYAACFP